MTTAVRGFSDSPKDYDIRVENRKVGVGVRIIGVRPWITWLTGRSRRCSRLSPT